MSSIRVNVPHRSLQLNRAAGRTWLLTLTSKSDAIDELLRTDPQLAASRVRPSAVRGDPQAQLLLGVLLINGLGVVRDPRAALRWFRAAAKAEVAMAMNMIGRCLEYGLGCEVDYEAAAQWYKRAAGYDCDWAIYNYAHLLASGRGVERDREAAFAWYQRSAEGGDYRGQCSYASVLAEQGHTDRALYWLERAVTTASPRHLRHFREELLQSPQPKLREFAASIEMPSCRA